MKPSACIDIGSNSALLSVAIPSANGWIQEIATDENITTLGKGVKDSGYLQQEITKPATEIILRMINKAIENNCENIFLIGTYALRTAKNTGEFIDEIYKKSGIKITVISGTKEAELSFIATDKSLPQINKKIVTDIGGGSTELILGVDGKIIKSTSITLGIVDFSDRLKTNSKEKIFAEILSTIEKGYEEFKNIDAEFIAIGGTPTTLSAINLRLEKYDPLKVHGSKITKEWIEIFLNKLFSISCKTADSKDFYDSIKCVSDKRMSFLPAGSLIMLGIMTYLKKDCVITSDAGLRHAVLYNYFYKNDTTLVN